MATFGVKFSLPTPANPADVAARELTVTVNGGDPPAVRTYPGTALLSDEWIFTEGDNVSVTLVDQDAKGNRSQASAAFAYEVTDTVPPTQPGTVGVTDIRQVS